MLFFFFSFLFFFFTRVELCKEGSGKVNGFFFFFNKGLGYIFGLLD